MWCHIWDMWPPQHHLEIVQLLLLHKTIGRKPIDLACAHLCCALAITGTSHTLWHTHSWILQLVSSPLQLGKGISQATVYTNPLSYKPDYLLSPCGATFGIGDHPNIIWIQLYRSFCLSSVSCFTKLGPWFALSHVCRCLYAGTGTGLCLLHSCKLPVLVRLFCLLLWHDVVACVMCLVCW
jgi:hypothetical protein